MGFDYAGCQMPCHNGRFLDLGLFRLPFTYSVPGVIGLFSPYALGFRSDILTLDRRQRAPQVKLQIFKRNLSMYRYLLVPLSVPCYLSIILILIGYPFLSQGIPDSRPSFFYPHRQFVHGSGFFLRLFQPQATNTHAMP